MKGVHKVRHRRELVPIAVCSRLRCRSKGRRNETSDPLETKGKGRAGGRAGGRAVGRFLVVCSCLTFSLSIYHLTEEEIFPPGCFCQRPTGSLSRNHSYSKDLPCICLDSLLPHHPFFHQIFDLSLLSCPCKTSLI